MTYRVAILFTALLFCLDAPAQWSYTRVPDEMRKTTPVRARMVSTNAHQFNFPYQGGARLSIIAWNDPTQPDPDDRSPVGLFLNKGQFSCFASDVCAIHIRVDDADVEPFSARLTEDSGLMWLYSNGAARLLDAIARNKALIVEVPVYQYGDRQFKFNLVPLKWPK